MTSELKSGQAAVGSEKDPTTSGSNQPAQCRRKPTPDSWTDYRHSGPANEHSNEGFVPQYRGEHWWCGKPYPYRQTVGLFCEA